MSFALEVARVPCQLSGQGPSFRTNPMSRCTQARATLTLCSTRQLADSEPVQPANLETAGTRSCISASRLRPRQATSVVFGFRVSCNPKPNPRNHEPLLSLVVLQYRGLEEICLSLDSKDYWESHRGISHHEPGKTHS